MKIKKFLGLILSVAMISVISVPGVVYTDAESNDHVTVDSLPDYILESCNFSDAQSIANIGMDDIYSITVFNDDETYTTLQFLEPVKYFDNASQEYRFIENDIIVSDDDKYAYENKANNFSSLFSSSSSDGVEFKDDEYSITMKPVSSERINASLVNGKSSFDYVSYGGVYGKNTDLRYSVESRGLKETLVLNENINMNSYSFDLSLENVYIDTFEGIEIEFKDSQTGENVFSLAPIFIQDSSESGNVTYNNYYNVEPIGDSTYRININLDEDFLNSTDTVYPCIVDPTIYYMRAGTIDGAYATQYGNTVNNNYFQVGSFTGVGECVSYLKVTGLENKMWLNPNNIINAELALYDCSSGYYNSGTVTCYRSNSVLSTSSVTYSQLNSAIGASIATANVSDNDCYYYFDITTLMTNWISKQIGQGGYSYNYGCIFKGSSSLIGRKAYKVDPNGQYYYVPYVQIKFTHDETLKNGIYKIGSDYMSNYIQYNGLKSNVTASSSTYSTIDKWKFTKVGDGTYTIQPYNKPSEYLYVASSNSGTYASVSNTVFKWYVASNTDGTYRILPASSINTSTALYFNSGNIRLATYINHNYWNWNITPIYRANVVNYFDNGYSVRYGENNLISKTILNSYMADVGDRYREILGLDFIYESKYYNSIVDQCKGTVTSSNINTLCSHNDNHTGYLKIKSSFTNDSSANNTLTAAYWTGHKVNTTGMGGVSNTSYNRSFSSGYRIYMLDFCDSSTRKYNSETILMHELNHQYGASDHYHEILDNGTCRGGIYCSKCGSSPRPSTCIMCVGYMNITSDDVICEGCKNQMITHLEGHHVN